jgi:CspA family cold shock protein
MGNIMLIRETGTVTSFNEETGQGRITRQGGGDDLAVHFKDVQSENKCLKVGKTVSFVAEKGRRGMMATQVYQE